MKIISNHTLLANQIILKKEKQISQTGKNTQQNFQSIYINSNFTPTFGERLHRSPENFYAQKFNQDNMPKTVKEYLYKDFSEHHHMPPAQLQREAFEYLKIADTIEDVKDAYPDEPLFQSLRTVNETKPSTGILLLLKWDAQTSNTPIFKDKENKDLTVYLLKKVYLEGKTISEINNDFDNDATEEIKRELGVKDKNYFSNSTFRTLGVKYPNLSYYNSFVATRNDKEYIPPKRKFTEHIVTGETKEKLSEASTKWWARLNNEEKAEQIKKMMDGKDLENNIYLKFQGQIMTIAAAQMGFSEKLTEIFSEKYANENFKQDFTTFAEQQRAIMLEFWNKDPEFRKNFSRSLQSIITDFEIAYHDKENPQKLETLLSQALALKEKVLNKAKEKRHYSEEMKKLATFRTQNQQQLPKQAKKTTIDYNSPKVLDNLFKQCAQKELSFFPTEFQNSFTNYLIKNCDKETKLFCVIDDENEFKKTLNISSTEYQQKMEKMQNGLIEQNKNYDHTNTLEAKTAEAIINKFLYDLTDQVPFLTDLKREGLLEIIYKQNRPEEIHENLKDFAQTVYDIIKNQDLKKLLLDNKKSFDKQMKKQCVAIKEKEAERILNIILSPNKFESAGDANWYMQMNQWIANDKKLKKDCIKFIQGYNAYMQLVYQNDKEHLQTMAMYRIRSEFQEFLNDKVRKIIETEIEKYKNGKVN